MHLDSHLGDEFPFTRVFREFAHFVNILCEGLLEVAMDAELHGGHGLGAVHVVGGSDADGVDVFGLFFEEFTPVLVEAGIGAVRAFAETLGAFRVNICGGDHVNGRVADDGADVGSGHASCAEACVANSAAGRRGDQIADESGGDDSGGAEGRQEGASGGVREGHAPILAGARPSWGGHDVGARM